MECRSSTKYTKNKRIEQLLDTPHIWRPGRQPTRRGEYLPTGFSGLDRLLGGGWPPGSLIEMLLERQGIGELRLLLPALRALQLSGARGHRRRHSCWIAPPYIPYAPALARHGLSLAQLLIVNPESRHDALWAAEQALRSPACSVVLYWAEGLGRQAIRRLQLGAEEAGSRMFLLRSARFARQSSMAPLRMRLQRADGGLQLELLRNRYGSPGQVTLPC